MGRRSASGRGFNHPPHGADLPGRRSAAHRIRCAPARLG
jgi:hypothetical protein